MPSPSGRYGMPTLRGRQGARSFVAAIVIDSLGVGLYIPVSLLYFTQVSKIDLGTVGWCLSAAALITLPMPMFVGRFVDRFGSRPVVVLGQLLHGIAFLGYLLVHEPVLLFATTLLARFGERFFWSSIFTLVADLSASNERDRWYALSSAARNIGIGLGSVIVAGLLMLGDTVVYQIVVGLNGLSYLVAAGLITLRVPGGAPRAAHGNGAANADADAGNAKDADDRRANPRRLHRDMPFLSYTAVNTVFALCVMLLPIALPIYATDALGAPGWVVGALTAVNITLLALVQTPVIHLVGSVRRTRIIAASGLLWALWAALMVVALAVPSGWLLVTYLFVSMLAFSAAELLHAPTSMALAEAAGPPEARGHYLSVFQFSFSIAGVVAPTMFAQAYDWDPSAPWIVLTALAVAASIGTMALERHLPKRAIQLTT